MHAVQIYHPQIEAYIIIVTKKNGALFTMKIRKIKFYSIKIDSI